MTMFHIDSATYMGHLSFISILKSGFMKVMFSQDPRNDAILDSLKPKCSLLHLRGHCPTSTAFLEQFVDMSKYKITINN